MRGSDDNTVLREHLRQLELRNLRAGTIRQRRYAIRRLADHLGSVSLLDATPEHLADYLGRPLSPEGRATEISHLRQFYRWCEEQGYVGVSPAGHLRRPRLPRRLPRPIEPDDLRHALREADDRVRPWLYLAAYAGLRCCEIAGLRREDVLLHHDPPMLLVVDGKGAKQRLVPIAAELEAEIRRWDLPRSGWLFGRRDGGPGPVPAHRVSQLANRHLKACGIDASIHQLRHLFGTVLYRRTRDLRLVQEVLGHANPNTTAGYAAWSPTDAADAISGLRY
jgi:integrase/recombinase XerC